MRPQVDWTKVLLLLVVLAGGGYALRDRIELPDLPAWTPVGVVEIPELNAEERQAVSPLAAIRANNPRAAKLLSEYLAASAWIVEHSDRAHWSSSSIAKSLETGGEHLAAMQAEAGTLPGFSAALNKSLDNLWGDEAAQLTKTKAARGVYACASGLQI